MIVVRYEQARAAYEFDDLEEEAKKELESEYNRRSYGRCFETPFPKMVRRLRSS